MIISTPCGFFPENIIGLFYLENRFLLFIMQCQIFEWALISVTWYSQSQFSCPMRGSNSQYSGWGNVATYLARLFHTSHKLHPKRSGSGQITLYVPTCCGQQLNVTAVSCVTHCDWLRYCGRNMVGYFHTLYIHNSLYRWNVTRRYKYKMRIADKALARRKRDGGIVTCNISAAGHMVLENVPPS